MRDSCWPESPRNRGSEFRVFSATMRSASGTESIDTTPAIAAAVGCCALARVGRDKGRYQVRERSKQA